MMNASGPSFSSLFGSSFSSLAESAPQVVESIIHLFTKAQQKKPEVDLWLDGSGSTCFDKTKSHDGKTFDKIYAQSLAKLLSLLPECRLGLWSSTAKIPVGDELKLCLELIKSETPFAITIPGMNGGTNPETILAYTQGKTVVLVTDGEIQNIETVRQRLIGCGIGSVFLVIIPHIDTYPNMYNNNANVEVDAKGSIRLSIPQAFAGFLATVIIWNYRKQAFEMISELSAPWVDVNKPLTELLTTPVPTVVPGEFLTKCDGQFMSFSFDKVLDWIKNHNLDENTINDLANRGVKDSIRQYGNAKQAETWDLCVMTAFNKVLAEKVKHDYVEVPVPNDLPILERMKIGVKNEHEMKRLDSIHRPKLAELFSKLLVGKTVGQIQNVAAAKTTQTIANVSAFQSMGQDAKLAEIAPVLVKSDCSICGTETECFSTISYPAKLSTQLLLCKEEKVIPGKKGKSRTVTNLDIDGMRLAFTAYPPKLHFLQLCTGCASNCLKQAHLPTDPEYGLTGLIPQNQVGGVVVDRLLLCPLITPERITDTSDPNDSRLSFARQWLRGFVAKTVGIDPAGAECMTVALMLLSALAHDEESAKVIFANQKSILSGGRNNKYKETVSRLFVPSSKKVSGETLMLISIVEEVIEKAGFPILPEANKLLLLCLIDRKVNVLIFAKNQRTKTFAVMNTVLHQIKEGGDSKDKEKFGISGEMCKDIQSAASVQVYKESHPEQLDRFVATYMQNVVGVNLQHIANQEASLIGVLNATNVKHVADGLYINVDHLEKMIARSKMTPDEFVLMVPKFIESLVHDGGKNHMAVLEKYL